MLRAADFYRILTEPEHNMLKQQAALLATEGIDLVFTEAAVREVARVAEEVGTPLGCSTAGTKFKPLMAAPCPHRITPPQI